MVFYLKVNRDIESFVIFTLLINKGENIYD